MSSNENDAMEWNDVLVEANIFIYYMSKSELRMQSYGRSKFVRKLGLGGEKVNPDEIWISDPRSENTSVDFPSKP